MHPDRGIVRTYRRSDSLSTRPDDHNTLTCQSSNTNDAPREKLLVPVTWNTYLIQPNLRYTYVYVYVYVPPKSQSPREICRWVKSLPIVMSGIRR